MWTLLLLLPSLSRGLELHPPCNESVDMGHSICSMAPSIRYHLDEETLDCLPFKFTGCGGNGNNFESAYQCRRKCLPMDYPKCPANVPPVKRADGSVNCNDSTERCPKGSICRKGFVVGLCCDENAIDRFQLDKSPNCAEKDVVKDVSMGFPITLIGKTCDHKFCPDGADCHQGSYYAYCCK
ncbi:hypothetical protein Q1695_003063 [Nippostrongylus brasiliensis]|nr:hypothetical protein Q1695_003063 [Nippostrongylus brasiliensis]